MEKVKLDSQLEWIAKLLERNNINYFINDGTLIGIIRDKKLIKWDMDIDIAIFEKDIKKMDKILKEAEKLRYKTNTYRYLNRIFGFSISPDNFFYNLFYPYIPKNRIEGNRKIDISVLREKNGFLWKPVLFSKGSDKKGFIFYFYKLIRGLNTIIQRLTGTSIIKGLYETGTCSVPSKYFKKSKTYLGLKIPYLAEDYLTFKYGNWKTPIKNWSYMRDDNSCKTEKPKS